METVSKVISAKMANMSFVCACLIVLFHATPAPEAGTAAWWLCHILGQQGLCSLAVPYFFFASGYFVIGGLGEDLGSWWRHEVKKRVKSLVVPFYIWLVIGTAFAISIWWMKAHVFHVAAEGNPLALSPVAFIFRMMGVHPFLDLGVVWYLRCLFLLVVMSPVFVWMLRFWKMFLCVILSAYLLFEALCGFGMGWNFYSFFDRLFSLRGILYFFLGMVFRVNGIRIDRMPTVCGVILLICGVVGFGGASIFSLNNEPCLSNIIKALVVPLSMSGIFTLLPSQLFPKWAVSNSFPIYLTHNYFLSIASMLLVVFKFREGNEIIIMVLRFLFGISLSVLLACMLKRYAARLSCLLFGGR